MLRALQDLRAAYDACAARTEALIGALVAADATRIRPAIAAQATALKAVEEAEMRRRLAARGLAHTLMGASPDQVGDGSLTMSALLRAISPESRAPLQEARHDLLLILRRVQLLQQRAMTLARNGHIAIRRTIAATIGSVDGYSARGERVPAQGIERATAERRV